MLCTECKNAIPSVLSHQPMRLKHILSPSIKMSCFVSPGFNHPYKNTKRNQLVISEEHVQYCNYCDAFSTSVIFSDRSGNEWCVTSYL